MIYYTTTIQNNSQENFEIALQSAISNAQRDGLRVEIQFQHNEGRFVALVIAHRE